MNRKWHIFVTPLKKSFDLDCFVSDSLRCWITECRNTSAITPTVTERLLFYVFFFFCQIKSARHVWEGYLQTEWCRPLEIIILTHMSFTCAHTLHLDSNITKDKSSRQFPPSLSPSTSSCFLSSIHLPPSVLYTSPCRASAGSQDGDSGKTTGPGNEVSSDCTDKGDFIF